MFSGDSLLCTLFPAFQRVVAPVLVGVWLFCPVAGAGSGGDLSRSEGRTCFQTPSAYRPEIDIQADVAIVYGGGPSLAERVATFSTMCPRRNTSNA